MSLFDVDDGNNNNNRRSNWSHYKYELVRTNLVNWQQMNQQLAKDSRIRFRVSAVEFEVSVRVICCNFFVFDKLVFQANKDESFFLP